MTPAPGAGRCGCPSGCQPPTGLQCREQAESGVACRHSSFSSVVGPHRDVRAHLDERSIRRDVVARQPRARAARRRRGLRCRTTAPRPRLHRRVAGALGRDALPDRPGYSDVLRCHVPQGLHRLRHTDRSARPFFDSRDRAAFGAARAAHGAPVAHSAQLAGRRDRVRGEWLRAARSRHASRVWASVLERGCQGGS